MSVDKTLHTRRGQIVQKVEGNVTFHTARSTAYAQPAPGAGPGPGPLTLPAEQLPGMLAVTSVSLQPHPARSTCAMRRSPQRSGKAMRNCYMLLNALVLTLLLGAGPRLAVSAEATSIVLAKEFMFAPTAVTVAAGSTVTWTNKDQEPHTVVSENGQFRSGALDTGDSFSFRFDKPGTYRYACSIHPRMVGTIVVQ
jgi:Icc protein